MSKMDALRAMREARYAEAQARAGKPATPRATSSKKAEPVKKAAAKRPAKKAASAPAAAATDAATTTEELCGHRNMSGRTCTREKGHAAKSHRYS